MGSVVPYAQQATDPETRVPRHARVPAMCRDPCHVIANSERVVRQRRGALTGLAEVAGRDDGDPETAG